jgi:hypothetical protein
MLRPKATQPVQLARPQGAAAGRVGWVGTGYTGLQLPLLRVLVQGAHCSVLPAQRNIDRNIFIHANTSINNKVLMTTLNALNHLRSDTDQLADSRSLLLSLANTDDWVFISSAVSAILLTDSPLAFVAPRSSSATPGSSFTLSRCVRLRPGIGRPETAPSWDILT